MNVRLPLACAALALMLAAPAARAEVKTVVDHNDAGAATAAFKFEHIRPPSAKDSATKATFTIVSGERDRPSGGLDVLHDGKTASEEDQPDANFFFAAGSRGGRIKIDLGEVKAVEQVNTYSWHPGTRGPQVYTLWAADGKSANFDATPKEGVDPATAGWKLLASVDTRPKEGNGGGQYAVSTFDAAGAIGRFQFLLLDLSRTESRDSFGNTFYTEIDVIAASDPKEPVAAGPADAPAGKPIEKRILRIAAAGKFDITIDTTETPELTEWAETKLKPVVEEWYPKLVAMLPSDGYTAPKSFSITFRKDKKGVADTGGNRVNCAADWFKKNLEGEARGAVVHEMVHVVQQYGRARGGSPNPGWLVEGLADYIRWFQYEPQSKRLRPSARTARYDASYRTTAAFLDYVTNKYDKDLVVKLNAAMRQGKYRDDLWKESTGKTVEELGTEWKESLGKG